MVPPVGLANLAPALQALGCSCTPTEAAELLLQLGQTPATLLTFPLFVEAYDALTYFRATGRVPQQGESRRERAEAQASEQAWRHYRVLATRHEQRLPRHVVCRALVGPAFDAAWDDFRQAAPTLGLGRRLADGALVLASEEEFKRAWARWRVAQRLVGQGRSLDPQATMALQLSYLGVATAQPAAAASQSR